MTDSPLVSIVVPTFNRAGPLARALASIKAQTYANFECIVVDDASNEATTREYDAIWRSLDDRFVLRLPTPGEAKGGNPSRTRNRGIAQARGDYIAFIDDDDIWIAEDHIALAVAALQEAKAGLFFADIRFSIHDQVSNPGWNRGQDSVLRRTRLAAGPDLFAATRAELARFLRKRHFHADTLVVGRDLLAAAGPYWEQANMAEDLELSIRLADRAERVAYRAAAVADLDASPHPSAIRRYDDTERAMYVVLACLRAEGEVSDPAMRRTARALRAWAMLDIAELQASRGRARHAFGFALQAAMLHPSMRALRLIARGGSGARGQAVPATTAAAGSGGKGA